MAWPTYPTVISAAARELGLVSADISDPAASTDANILQLVKLLDGLGQDLARRYCWQHLTREGSITTASGFAHYALPADFLGFVEQTFWNRTQDLPVPPLSPVQWQAVKGGSVTSVWQSLRVRGNRAVVDPTPTASEDIYFEYFSSYWVDRTVAAAWAQNTAYTAGQRVTKSSRVYECDTAGTSVNDPAGGPSTEAAAITDGTVTWRFVAPSTLSEPGSHETVSGTTDLCMFDLRLLTLGLKLAWRAQKSLEALWHNDEFARAVDAALSRSDRAPVLSLNGRLAGRRTDLRLLDGGNLPDGGYG